MDPRIRVRIRIHTKCHGSATQLMNIREIFLNIQISFIRNRDSVYQQQQDSTQRQGSQQQHGFKQQRLSSYSEIMNRKRQQQCKRQQQ